MDNTSQRSTSMTTLMSKNTFRNMNNSMPPPSIRPRSRHEIKKKKRTALNEDDYIKVLSSIIERDYFPETKKLKDQLNILNDLEKNNVPSHIQKKLMDGKSKGSNNVNQLNHYPSSSSSSLVSSSFSEEEGDDNQSQLISVVNAEGHDDDDDSDGGKSDEDDESLSDNQTITAAISPPRPKDRIDISQMTIDGFFRRYTSQDNESFETIHANDKAYHRKKYHWAYDNDDDEGANNLISSERQHDMITNNNGSSSSSSIYTSSNNPTKHSSCISSRRSSARGDPQLMLYYIGDKVLTASERQKMDTILAQGEYTAGDNVYDHRPSVPQSWPYRARNQLMFPPVLKDSEDICRIPEQREQKLLQLQQQEMKLISNETATTADAGASSSSTVTATITVFVPPDLSLPLPFLSSSINNNTAVINKRVSHERQREAKQIHAHNTSLYRQQQGAGVIDTTVLISPPLSQAALLKQSSSLQPLEGCHTPTVYSDAISVSVASSSCINDIITDASVNSREYKLVSMTPIIVPTGDRHRYIQEAAIVSYSNNSTSSSGSVSKTATKTVSAGTKSDHSTNRKEDVVLEEELVVQEMEPIMTYGELFAVPRLLDPPPTAAATPSHSANSNSSRSTVSTRNSRNKNIVASSTHLPSFLLLSQQSSSSFVYELQPERRRDTLARDLDAHWQQRAATSSSSGGGGTSLYSSHYDRMIPPSQFSAVSHTNNNNDSSIDDSHSVMTRGTTVTTSTTTKRPRHSNICSRASVASIYTNRSMKSISAASSAASHSSSDMSTRGDKKRQKKPLSAAATAMVKRLSSSS